MRPETIVLIAPLLTALVAAIIWALQSFEIGGPLFAWVGRVLGKLWESISGIVSGLALLMRGRHSRRAKLSAHCGNGSSRRGNEGIRFEVVVRNDGERKAWDVQVRTLVSGKEAAVTDAKGVRGEDEERFTALVPAAMCEWNEGRLVVKGAVRFEVLHGRKVVARCDHAGPPG